MPLILERLSIAKHCSGTEGGAMGECENLANLKLTIKEIQRKLVEGCECAAKSFKSEYNGFSAEQCLLLGVGAMLFGALLGIQGFAFYKRAVLLVL